MATERGEGQRAGAEGGIWGKDEEEEEAIETGAKSPAQGLGGAGHSGGGNRRRGPQGGQREEEGLGAVPEAASLRPEGLWAGVFPALGLSSKV